MIPNISPKPRTLDYMANGVTAELSCLVVCGSAHSILNPATWFPEPKRLGRDSTTRELWAETSSDALFGLRFVVVVVVAVVAGGGGGGGGGR